MPQNAASDQGLQYVAGTRQAILDATTAGELDLLNFYAR